MAENELDAILDELIKALQELRQEAIKFEESVNQLKKDADELLRLVSNK
jgi:hypothetical protein